MIARTRFDIVADGLGQLRERMRIAVVYNGESTAPGAIIRSTFNPRSDKCYKPVAEDIASALSALGFKHVCVVPEDLNLGQALRDLRVDFAWLNTAGVQGYDAVTHAPAVLELAGIPYIGPVSGRASHHVKVATGPDELESAVDEVYAQTQNLVQIEPFLRGREYCVSVSGPVLVRQGMPVRMDGPFVFSAVERLLDPGELIFTSPDARPITKDRVQLLGPQDGPVYDELLRLARSVWGGFQLRTLIRLDIRADANGRLQILEANPKPDLKRPVDDFMSLVCAGLPQQGMTYEDLILSLLWDRLDHYLRNRPAVVSHIVALL